MNILLCLSHSIEEYDQLRLLSGLGYNVASIGGYIDPRHPHADLRPALDIDPVPGLQEAIDGVGERDNLGAAQAHLPDIAIAWADVIIYHHRLERLFGQWDRLADFRRRGRIIWRTVGQSVEYNELQARPFRRDGLEIVRYSPKERNIPGFAGEDALIRFYKDPEEWQGWTGEDPVVLNIAQHDETPYARSEWLNWRFWEQATKGLPRTFAGPNTEKIGGLGKLSEDDMKALLRRSRVYLYTGTQPASYTLGLIEAMMTGIPIVSIGHKHMQIFPYGSQLFEGPEIVWPNIRHGDSVFARSAYYPDLDEPGMVHSYLAQLIANEAEAQRQSTEIRARAVELFGMETIGRQWDAYLQGTKVEFSTERQTVSA